MFNPVLNRKNSLTESNSKISLTSAVLRRPLPKRIFIPLHSVDLEQQEVIGILTKLHLGGTKVPRHLLWHLLFKGIRVIEWYLLFEFLCRNQEAEDKLFNACLFGVLRESSLSRRTNVDFFSHLRPIHKKFSSLRLRSDIVNSEEFTLLDLITKKLEIPQKGLPLGQILTVNDDVLVKYPKPIPANFIGVGYKDKGSMGPEVCIDITEEEILLEHSKMFEEYSLKKEWKELLSNFRRK